MSFDVLYRAEARATGGGREGLIRLLPAGMTMVMAPPKALGGSGAGHNPEELFALGYAACYLSAMRHAARSENLGKVPDDASVNAEVGIGKRADGGFGLTVRLTVGLPGLDPVTAARIMDRGHHVCPYSHATAGNITTETVLI